MGRLLGQALLEKRLLDLPLSSTLLKALVQPDSVFAEPSAADIDRAPEAVAQSVVASPVSEPCDPLNVHDLAALQPEVGRHLLQLHGIVQKKYALLYQRVVADQYEREQRAAACSAAPASVSVTPVAQDSAVPMVLDTKAEKEEKVAISASASCSATSSASSVLPDLPAPALSAADRAQLRMDGADIEDLCLDFTVPGWPPLAAVGNGTARVVVPLRTGGAEQSVTLDTLELYVDAVVRFFLVDGVQPALQAIRKGLGEVCSPLSLRCFQTEEVEELLCGGAITKWDFSVPTLRKYVKCRQGYTHSSRAVQHLFSILSEFDAREQRHFIRFVTGCPRLPMGGLKNLSPPLAIVPLLPVSGSTTPPPPASAATSSKTHMLPMRSPAAASSASSSSASAAVRPATREPLPSVSTCTMTLKLPDYATKEQMKPKLLLAMSECQTGFSLS